MYAIWRRDLARPPRAFLLFAKRSMFAISACWTSHRLSYLMTKEKTIINSRVSASWRRQVVSPEHPAGQRLVSGSEASGCVLGCRFYECIYIDYDVCILRRNARDANFLTRNPTFSGKLNFKAFPICPPISSHLRGKSRHFGWGHRITSPGVLCTTLCTTERLGHAFGQAFSVLFTTLTPDTQVGNKLQIGLDLIVDYFGCFWLD